MESLLQALGGDLRLALLLLGGVLVLGIVVWELLQRRRARHADAEHRAGPLGQPREPTADMSVPALEDPLLADALDGFRMANRDTTADLNLLRSQLDERIEANQAAIRQMPSTRFFSPFLRVAALLFILIGAGWFSYVFWVGPRDEQG